MIIYDCEIKKAIPPPLEKEWIKGIEYCHGWDDYKGMGISVICVFDENEFRYRVFLEDNFDQFCDLARDADGVISFNGVAFDDRLCAAHGIKVKTTYDLLREVRIASGQPPDYEPGVTRAGYNLEALAQANLGTGKTGYGELAPILWQQGKFGQVVDYCLHDVEITRRLYEERSRLKDPTNGDRLSLPYHPSACRVCQASMDSRSGWIQTVSLLPSWTCPDCVDAGIELAGLE